MSKTLKIIISVIVAIAIIFFIGMAIDNNYNADKRAAERASQSAREASERYEEAKDNYDKTKQDIENYKKSVNRVKGAK